MQADALHLDAVTALQDLAAGQEPISGEVDQALLTGLKLVQLFGDLIVQLLRQLLATGEGLADQVGHRLDEVVVQAEIAVVPLDLFFDLPARQMRQVAEAFLPTPAQEVAVDAAGALRDLGVDQAAATVVCFAASAEDHALEVVLQDSVAVALGGALPPDVLDTVEQLLRDDRIVSPLNEFVINRHPAGVVRVGEHPVQLVARHRHGLRVAARRSGRQSEIRHRGFKRIDRVLAAGV
nr:hypothetical protein [Jatrophihabitans endophyticus]